MVATLFLLFTLLLALSVPIFIVLSLSTLGAFVLHSAIPLETVVQRLFAGLDKFALMAIPFFILAANVMSVGGMSRRIIAVANVLVGWLPGGLAMASVLACLFFGAISGSSPATVVAMGSLLYPALVQAGYGRRFAIAERAGDCQQHIALAETGHVDVVEREYLRPVQLQARAQALGQGAGVARLGRKTHQQAAEGRTGRESVHAAS